MVLLIAICAAGFNLIVMPNRRMSRILSEINSAPKGRDDSRYGLFDDFVAPDSTPGLVSVAWS